MGVFRTLLVSCCLLLQGTAQTPEWLDHCAIFESQLCRCDAECELFGDCCPWYETTTASNVAAPLFECHSTYLNSSVAPGENEAFWMVSACPESWGDSLEETFVEGNCTDGASNLPVSNTTTGQVYKNEYCAICNGVMDVIAWRYRLTCNCTERLRTTGFVLTQEILSTYCSASSFVQPELPLNNSAARTCFPHIASCLEQSELENRTGVRLDNYDSLVRQCTTNNGSYSLVSINNRTLPFRNQYCAMCNGVNRGLSCYVYIPLNSGGENSTCATDMTETNITDPLLTTTPPPTTIPSTTTVPPNTTVPPTAGIFQPPLVDAGPLTLIQPIYFSLVLDIQGNGLVVARTDTITTNIMAKYTFTSPDATQKKVFNI